MHWAKGNRYPLVEFLSLSCSDEQLKEGEDGHNKNMSIYGLLSSLTAQLQKDSIFVPIWWERNDG